MATWFTADTHFGHAGARALYRRPFPDVAAMDAALVERWNEAVAPADDVWHLGDFAYAADLNPPLTSVRIDGARIGRLAARCIVERAEGRTVAERVVDVGFSIDLTIDPALQALAQKTAACYTGRHDVCQALGLRRADDKGEPLGAPLLEGAMVRMAAIAVVDILKGPA